jgi:N-alpha-acetyltransferase 10/11
MLSWPQLSWVAEAENGRIVGYVLSKMYVFDCLHLTHCVLTPVCSDEDTENTTDETHGHITSVAVLRSHRRLGLATRLMVQAHMDMRDVFGVTKCCLHVREGNVAARSMYMGKLGYHVAATESKYYGDGEDALYCQCELAQPCAVGVKALPKPADEPRGEDGLTVKQRKRRRQRQRKKARAAAAARAEAGQ